MLIDDGVIVKSGERWHVELSRMAGVRVPPTLTGLLQARLDGLPPLERKTLQRAAVIGRVFCDGAVRRLNRDAGIQEDETTRALVGLQSKGLIFQTATSACAGQQEYVFKHTILHGVVYESVLKRERRACRARIAAWLASQGREQVTEYASAIGAERRVPSVGWHHRAERQAQDAGASHADAGPFPTRDRRKWRSRWARMPLRLALCGVPNT